MSQTLDLLTDAGKAYKRICEIDLIVDSAAMPTKRGAGSKPLVSDPTAAAASYYLDTLPKLLDERSMRAHVIDEAEIVLKAVASAFGEVRAEMMRQHYIYGLAWRTVAAQAGLAESTARLKCMVAVEHADSLAPYEVRAACGGFAEK